jgi:hypothetical protein
MFGKTGNNQNKDQQEPKASVQGLGISPIRGGFFYEN